LGQVNAVNGTLKFTIRRSIRPRYFRVATLNNAFSAVNNAFPAMLLQILQTVSEYG